MNFNDSKRLRKGLTVLVLFVALTGFAAAENKKISTGEKFNFEEGDTLILDPPVEITYEGIPVTVKKVDVNRLFKSSGDVKVSMTVHASTPFGKGEKNGEIKAGNRYTYDDFAFYFCSARAHYSNEEVYNGTAVMKEGDHPPMDEVCDSVGVEEIKNSVPEIQIISPEDKLYSRRSFTPEVSADADVDLDWSYSLNNGEFQNYNPNSTEIQAEQGKNTLTIKADDGYGNSDTGTVEFSVDSETPQISLEAPSEGYRNKNWISVKAKVNDPHLEKITVNLDGDQKEISSGEKVNFTGLEDGEKTLEVKAEDSAGNSKTVTRTYTIDTDKPDFKLFKPENRLYSHKDLSIEVTTSEKIEWRYILNGNSQSFSPNTTITAKEGKNHLEVRAEDKAGNTVKRTRNFRVDTTPPTINYNDKTTEKGKITSSSITLNISATDNNLKTVKASLNGEETDLKKTDSGNYLKTFENLREGEHVLKAWAVDKAGNRAELEQRKYLIDTEKPDIKVKEPVKKTYSTNSITLDVSANENVAWEYSLNGNKKSFEPGKRIKGLENGDYTLEIYATDDHGNTASKTVSFKINRVKPSFNIVSPENKIYNTESIQLETKSDSNIVEWRYNLGNGNKSFSSPEKLEGLQDGRHEVKVWGKAGNGLWNLNSRRFTVDTEKPNIEISDNSTSTGKTSQDFIYIHFSAEDPNLENSYVALEDEIIRGGEANFTGLEPGNYTVKVEAVDKANNAELRKLDYRILPEEPVKEPKIEIVRPQNRLYSKKSVELEVISNKDLDWSYNLNNKGETSFRPNTSIKADEGENTVRVTGKSEETTVEATRKFEVDTISPEISFEPSSTEQGRISEEEIVVNFSIDDANPEKVEAKLNGESLEVDKENENYYFKKVEGLETGSNTLEIHAVDKAGNREVVRREYILDDKAPEITVFSPEDKIYSSGSVELKVSADEEVENWRYEIDGAVKSFRPNTTVSGLGTGEHEIKVYADDLNGNTGTEAISFRVEEDEEEEKDESPPSLSILSPSNRFYSSSQIELDVSSSSSIQSWKYSLDGEGNSSFSPGANISGLGNGEHTLKVWAQAENGLWSSKTQEFKVDTKEPVVEFDETSTPTGTIEQSWIFVNVSAEDENLKAVETYSADQQKGAEANFTGLGEGNHLISVEAVDKAGNVRSITRSYEVKLPEGKEPGNENSDGNNSEEEDSKFELLKPENKTYNSSVPIEAVRENISQVLYSVNGGVNRSLTQGSTINSTGSNTLTVWYHTGNWRKKTVNFQIRPEENNNQDDKEQKDNKNSGQEEKEEESSGSSNFGGGGFPIQETDEQDDKNNSKKEKPNEENSEEKEENSAPEARFNIIYPSNGGLDNGVKFDASYSTDDSGIEEYRWSFGAKGQEVEESFQEPRKVTLTVVDDRNATDSVTKQIREKNEQQSFSIKALKDEEEENKRQGLGNRLTGSFAEVKPVLGLEQVVFGLGVALLMAVVFMGKSSRIDFP
ncbi:MAG: Ig-like domain repeat protein [Candidatus Nanohalobium sp.]